MRQHSVKALHTRLRLAIAVAFLAVLTAFPASSQSAGSVSILQLMIVEDIDCGCTSADIYAPLQASLDSFREETGITVAVSRAPETRYRDALEIATLGDTPPDVIWLRPADVSAFVRAEKLMPLDAIIGDIGDVLEETPGWALEQFVFGGRLYGVPLGREGVLLDHGYALTSAAEERGKSEIARALIAHLKRTVPLDGLPDLVVRTLEIDSRNGNGETVAASERTPERDRIRLVTEIANVGDAPARAFAVSVQIDDRRPVARREIEVLDPQESLSVEFSIRAPEPDSRLIKLIADSANAVPESNENNNYAIGKYAAGLSGPPPAPVAVGTPFCLQAKAYRTDVWGMGPKVAFDGTNYLVVWARQTALSGTTYNHELRAARVSPAGAILDPGGFVVAVGPKKYNTFNLAYGAGRYMLVWEEDLAYSAPNANPRTAIRGTLVSPQGKLLIATPFAVETGKHPGAKGWNPVKHVSPDVYFGSNEFAVVYRTAITGTDQIESVIAEKSGVYVRRVSIQGKVQTGKKNVVPFGKSHVGFDLQRAAFAQDRAILAHDGYDSTKNAGGVHGTWITMPSGIPQATVPSSLAANKSAWFFENPAAAAVWPSFLTIWESSVGKPQLRRPDLYGAIGTASGTQGGTFSAAFPIVKGQTETWPAVDYDGTNFTLAYNHHIGCLNHVGAVRVTPAGVVGQTTHFNSIWSLVGQVDIAFGSSNGLIVFEKFNKPTSVNGPDFSWGICARRISK